MAGKLWALISALLLYAATAAAQPEAADDVLRVYGPGGPYRVISECAELFEMRHGVKVSVIKALPHDLEKKVRIDGDIYFGGAEYMLDRFDRRNPGVLDLSTRESLHPRRIGILVRKGNPLQITGSSDLAKKGLHLLDVKLENMRNFHGSSSELSHNIRHFKYTGQEGVNSWLAHPEIDAWVTYRSWHLVLEDEADFIDISEESGLRFTPVALTSHTRKRQDGLKFISFLKSDDARQIFEKYGWY